jgi:diacylglycerol O-acyltransferase
MAAAYQINEALLPRTPNSPTREERKVSAISNPKGGRKRAASATTRVFGHFMAEKTPRATWAVGVLKLEKDPGGDRLKEVLWNRLMKMARFRSKLVVSRHGGYWQELPEAELIQLRDTGYLWEEVCQNVDATMDDVNDVINQVNSWDYDRLKPLWRAQYCRKMADGSAVLICTINHGIGDGVSLVATLLGMKDPETEEDRVLANSRRETKPMSGKKARGPKLGPLSKAGAFSYGIYHGLTSSYWKPDPPNALSIPDVTKPSKEKRVAQADPIPLDEMKAVKNRFPGATLNDIMMAVMTASIKAYLEEVQDPSVTNGNRVRGAFPINLRSPNEPVLRNGDPMNKWAYGTFNFDFDYKSRIDLVWKVKRQIDKIKVSPSPAIQYKLAGVLTNILPRKVLLDQLLNMANLATAQLSNVPGPQAPITIAGVKVEDLSFYLFAPVGLYFGIMSYNGWVSAGVNVDGTTKVDPKMLAKHWKLEFDALKAECDALGPGVQAPVPRYWL